MRYRENRVRASRVICALVSMSLLAMTSHAAYVINKQNNRIDGTEIRARANGDIILKTLQGTQTFPRGGYLKAVADKPAAFDQAVRAVKAQQYAQASKLLEQIIKDYRLLEWDNQARKLLPKVFLKQGEYSSAVKAFDDLYLHCEECKDDAELRWSYMEALLRGEDFDRLDSELGKIISTGDRASAARAQILRGDMNLAQGNPEDALLDYLRTVVLFEQEKEHQPEALFKTAETLEKLIDGRAKNFYQRVAQEYPNSSYAGQARQKL